MTMTETARDLRADDEQHESGTFPRVAPVEDEYDDEHEFHAPAWLEAAWWRAAGEIHATLDVEACASCRAVRRRRELVAGECSACRPTNTRRWRQVWTVGGQRAAVAAEPCAPAPFEIDRDLSARNSIRHFQLAPHLAWRVEQWRPSCRCPLSPVTVVSAAGQHKVACGACLTPKRCADYVREWIGAGSALELRSLSRAAFLAAAPAPGPRRRQPVAFTLADIADVTKCVWAAARSDVRVRRLWRQRPDLVLDVIAGVMDRRARIGVGRDRRATHKVAATVVERIRKANYRAGSILAVSLRPNVLENMAKVDIAGDAVPVDGGRQIHRKPSLSVIEKSEAPEK